MVAAMRIHATWIRIGKLKITSCKFNISCFWIEKIQYDKQQSTVPTSTRLVWPTNCRSSSSPSCDSSSSSLMSSMSYVISAEEAEEPSIRSSCSENLYSNLELFLVLQRRSRGGKRWVARGGIVKAERKTNHPLVLAVVLLQPLDPGLALLHAPHVASLGHLLCDLREDVAVLQAALQGALHWVLPPDIQQVERLLVRPGGLSVQHHGQGGSLWVWREKTEGVVKSSSERPWKWPLVTSCTCVISPDGDERRICVYIILRRIPGKS